MWAWISDALSLPAPQDPRPVCLPSRFTPRAIHNRERFLGVLSFQIDGFLTDPSWIQDDIQPMNQMESLVLWMVHQNAFGTVFSHQTIGLEYFADSSHIPWHPPTNFHPDLIATIQKMSLLWFCVLPSQQSHLFLNGEELMCNDFTIDLHRIAKFQGIAGVNVFWFPCRLQELLQVPFSFLWSFCFFTDKIESIEWLSLAPQLRIGDCFEMHNLQ